MAELFCADSSSQRLENAFEKYADTVFRLGLARTKNITYADDILGEVFLRLVKNIDKLQSEAHIKAWLIRVTVNCSKTYMKRLYKEGAALDENIPAFDSYETGEVYNSVLSLPEKYRTVIHLFYYEDMSVKEISHILSQSDSATKMQLKRAKEKLRAALGEDFF